MFNTMTNIFIFNVTKETSLNIFCASLLPQSPSQLLATSISTLSVQFMMTPSESCMMPPEECPDINCICKFIIIIAIIAIVTLYIGSHHKLYKQYLMHVYIQVQLKQFMVSYGITIVILQFCSIIAVILCICQRDSDD